MFFMFCFFQESIYIVFIYLITNYVFVLASNKNSNPVPVLWTQCWHLMKEGSCDWALLQEWAWQVQMQFFSRSYIIFLWQLCQITMLETRELIAWNRPYTFSTSLGVTLNSVFQLVQTLQQQQQKPSSCYSQPVTHTHTTHTQMECKPTTLSNGRYLMLSVCMDNWIELIREMKGMWADTTPEKLREINNNLALLPSYPPSFYRGQGYLVVLDWQVRVSGGFAGCTHCWCVFLEQEKHVMGALEVPLPMGFVVEEDRKIRVCQLLLNLFVVDFLFKFILFLLVLLSGCRC